MSRFFAEIKYDGSNYHGWQIQQNANSVQAEINKALCIILQREICVTGAGRTDTGVHAKQLFVHFDVETEFDIPKILYKLNNFLPDDISVRKITKVTDDAHARFSADSRTYEYWITPLKDPFLTNKAYFLGQPLDLNIMNQAASKLLNYSDFSCFSKSNTNTHTNNCNITFAHWEKKNNCLVFTITSDRFLRNMVRAIVGTLLDIGQHKFEWNKLDDIIKSKNRSEAGTSAPAHGLYLTQIIYPEEVLNG